MPSFYWIDSRELAAVDAQEKGVISWIWAATKEQLNSKDYMKFDAIYLKTGINELEVEFSRIMRENKPKWSC